MPKDERSINNDITRLGAGIGLVSAGNAARNAVAVRHGSKGFVQDAKDIKRNGFKSKHAKVYGTKLATRGLITAGIPLGVTGATGILNEKKRSKKPIDLKSDVIGGVVNRSMIKAPNMDRLSRADSERKRAKLVDLAAVTGAGSAGSAIGSKLAGTKLKSRIAAGTFGGTIGAIGGAMAGYPIARKAVPAMTGGEYTHTKNGPRKVSKMRTQDAAINTLSNKEKGDLIRRKKTQQQISLASAGLGLGAVGLRTPQMVGHARKIRPLKNSKALKRIELAGNRLTPISDTVGTASIGLGSAGSLNFARIQRSEAKADDRAANIKKALPVIRPKKFGGVRAGSFKRIPTRLGTKTVYQRGSLG